MASLRLQALVPLAWTVMQPLGARGLAVDQGEQLFGLGIAQAVAKLASLQRA